ncbi:YadA-like family protein [Lysobacter panacisoli]
MNTAYRLVWSVTHKTWVVASELAHGNKKGPRASRSVLAVALASGMLFAAGNAMAIDEGTASGVNSTAIGVGSSATDSDAVAIGTRATSSAEKATAIGVDSVASGQFSIAIGSDAQATQTHALALGSNSRALGVSSTAFGQDAQATADYSAAFGSGSRADGSSTGLGQNANAQTIDGQGWATAVGNSSVADHVGATALGASAKATADRALSLGADASASVDTAVALGSGSVADRAGMNGATELFSGVAVASTSGAVSVGTAGGERQIVNVAGGTLDTDAVNIRQLKTVQSQLAAADAGAVKYEWTDTDGDGVVDPGEIDYTKVVLEGAPAGTTISNLADGDVSQNSTEAINGSQLYDIAGDTSAAYVTLNGRGVRYVRTNDAGLTEADAYATGQGSTAVGYEATSAGDSSLALGRGATASNAEDVALGSGSVTAAAVGTASTTINGDTYQFAGTNPTSTVSVGNAGAERTITNVAAGRISADSTDAINGSQLYATNQAIEKLDGRVDTVKGDVINLDDRVTTVEGDVQYINETVAAYDNRLTNVEGSVTNLQNGSDGMFQVSQDAPVVKPVASGGNASAGGNGAVASGDNSLAVGNQSSATGDGSTAIGQGASATHDNSVAIGTGSATTVGAQTGYNGAFVGPSSSTGEVNVGGRTITGVAPGTAGTDAANVNQLNAGVNHAIKQSNAYTDSRISEINQQVGEMKDDIWALDRGYRGATASAMAMAGLPQAYLPGKNLLAVGMGGFQGEYGMALGMSGISDNGRWIYKGQVSGNTTSDFGFSVGAGIQW